MAGTDGQPDVVVVEDNEDEARMTLMSLRRIEPAPKVVVIPDGQQAIDQLTGETHLRPQVVLLDLKLPKVHGLDILAAIKAGAEKMAVLILTSSDHPADIERAQSLGCDGYLCKPIDWEEYVQLVCRSTARYLKDSSCG